MNNFILKKIGHDVKQHLAKAEGGHDWWHIQRVLRNALEIASTEDGLNHDVVSIAALLHDIADPKFHNGDEDIGPQIAEKIMVKHGVDNWIVHHVLKIIRYMSFKNSLGGQSWMSPELQVVQDADRLDAIGAIGIARAFSYGGYKNRALYNPDIAPKLNMTKQEYKKNTAPTINHFYEKLLKLKDLMNTTTGKKMAQERHDFLIVYLDQFFNEIGINPDWR